MYPITSPKKNVCYSLTSLISSKVIFQSSQNVMYPITSPINNCWLQFNLTKIEQSHSVVSQKCNVSNDLTNKKPLALPCTHCKYNVSNYLTNNNCWLGFSTIKHMCDVNASSLILCTSTLTKSKVIHFMDLTKKTLRKCFFYFYAILQPHHYDFQKHCNANNEFIV